MTAFEHAFRATRLPEDTEQFREEVKAFLADHAPARPPHIRARSWAGFDADFSRALGSRGWLGLTLPTRYGGGGKGPFARFVLVEELLAIGAPVAAHWIGDRQSAPLLLHYGTEEQRNDILPRICAGELFFCIGMSEPNSGSDLASVRTRARRDGDEWVLNGSKIWTTYAHKAHYMIALVRTSGGPEDRQKGLSQFLIDLHAPGLTTKPIVDLCGDAHFSEVFFEDVRLPANALVGAEGDGWKQVNAELAFERSGPERIYSSIVLLDLWAQYLASSGTGDAAQRIALGKCLARMAALREMSIAITGRLDDGESPVIEAALIKDLGTTLEQDIPSEIAQLTGDPDLPVDDELIRTLAYVMQVNPAYSLRGGTREILRGMIARGLGLR
ncbi:acyl-CoA dehydrogenase family protein [Sphingobium sp. AN558]|uniref:acyl-CoA dehydrogenase family protein n=1 Tax=Sphingobium sp. AN558 TaxID=3133442 RepID=UPI0030BD4234